MLHIVPDIQFCGPSWTTWTFYMERYCGFLKARLRSRKFPWANLNNTVLNYAYLEQIGERYDLADELAIYGIRKNGPSASEQTFENCVYISCTLSSTAHLLNCRFPHHSTLPTSQKLRARCSIAQENCRIFRIRSHHKIQQIPPITAQSHAQLGKASYC